MYSFTSIEYLRSICFSLAPTPSLYLAPSSQQCQCCECDHLAAERQRQRRVHHNTQPEPRPGPFSTAQNKN